MGLTGPVQPNDIVMRASEIGTTIPGVASLAMKTARKGAQRGVQGIYQLPGGQEPTPEFMNVSQQNLNNQTQQMTDMLNSMAPQDERLAYINEEEAGILKLLGGSGNMTPQGIPSFEPGGNMSPGGDTPDLSPGQRRRFDRYDPSSALPQNQGQAEIYRAYMDRLAEDNPARQNYFTTGNPTLPTADEDKEMGEEMGRDTGFDYVTMPNPSDPSDRFERGGPRAAQPPSSSGGLQNLPGANQGIDLPIIRPPMVGDPGFDPGEMGLGMGIFPTVIVDTPEGPMDYGAAVRAGYDPTKNFGMPEGDKTFKDPKQGTNNYNFSLPYETGGPVGNIRTGDFRDSNNNGIDDRDEQSMGGSDYFDYMKYIARPKQAAAELAATAPEGEFPAYINASEAELLRMYGGSGTTSNNPAEIPSFRGGGQDQGAGASGMGSAGHGGGGSGSGGGGSGNGNNKDKNKDKDKTSSSASTGRPSMADIAGGYNTPSGEKPGPGNPDRDTGATNVEDAQKRAKDLTEKQKQRNRDIVDAGATVTGAGKAMVDKEGGLIAAGRALDAFRAQREKEQTVDKRIRQYTLANMDPQARSMLSNLDRTSYADAGNLLGSISDTDLGMTRNMINDRRKDLLSGEKLSVAELNELGEINQFMGDDVTKGMSLGQELKHKFTNDEFRSDLDNLTSNPVVGFALKGPAGLIAPALKYGYKQYKSYNRPKMTFVDGRAVFTDTKTGKLVKDVEKTAKTAYGVARGLKAAENLVNIAGATEAPLAARALFGGINALNLNKSVFDLSKGKYGVEKPLTGSLDGIFNRKEKEKEKDKYARTTSPIGYLTGTGSFNNYGVGSNNNTAETGMFGGRDGNDSDPFIYAGNEETEEEKQKARDRFERAFAQRYFIGPTTLPEVRKYAVTGGGYNQLTPYGIG